MPFIKKWSALLSKKLFVKKLSENRLIFVILNCLLGYEVNQKREVLIL